MRGEVKLTSKQKAARGVISLGAERAAKVYKHLRPDEVENLTIEVASYHRAEPEKAEAVLEEFGGLCMASRYVAEGGAYYAL